MADGVTVDANVIKQFTDAYLQETDSASRFLVEKLVAVHGIVVDEGGKIQCQWFQTCNQPFVQEWFFERVRDGSIRLVRPTVEPKHRKKLVNDLGFPPTGFELTYIWVANATSVRYILTEDIDFFDPTLKKAEQAAKKYAKEKRRGQVCKYLRDKMDITVGTVAHAETELLTA